MEENKYRRLFSFPLFLLIFLLSFCWPHSLGAEAASFIQIYSPRDRLLTHQDHLMVKGKAKGLKNVLVNGNSVELDLYGRFAVDAILHPGKNLVVVKGTDARGKMHKVTRRVLREILFVDMGGLEAAEKHWSWRIVTPLASLGIIEGYPDQTFRPEKPVTMGELATWVVRTQKAALPELTADPFVDIPREHWRAPYIKVAVDKGYMAPYSGGVFGLGDGMSRAGAMNVFTRLAEVKEPKVVGRDLFVDVSRRETEAKTIYGAYKAGLIIGMAKWKLIFMPTKDLTRAEAATIISRLPSVRRDFAYLYNWQVGYDYSRLCQINNAPSIVVAEAQPPRIFADGKTPLKLLAKVKDRDGLEDILLVRINLSSIGGPPDSLMVDDGTQGDEKANDGTYSLEVAVNPDVVLGLKQLLVEVTDRQGAKEKAKIKLAAIKANHPPAILSALAIPMSVKPGAKSVLAVSVKDIDGRRDVDKVAVDLRDIGGREENLLYDDGSHGDHKAEDGIYMLEVVVSAEATAGMKNLPVKVADRAGALTEDKIQVVVKKPKSQ